MKHKKKDNGFTLIELLATILIISIVLGIGTYFFLNTINKSKDTAQELTLKNLMTAARTYIQENPNKIIWNNHLENTNQQFSCISIKTLINQNLIKEKNIEDLPEYIIITKNKKNGSIISEKIDKNNQCN